MNTVIKVENLSKKYIISHQRQERFTALRDVITDKFKALGKRLKAKGKGPYHSPFALRPSPSSQTQKMEFVPNIFGVFTSPDKDEHWLSEREVRIIVSIGNIYFNLFLQYQADLKVWLIDAADNY
jgi:hypothetical protein